MSKHHTSHDLAGIFVYAVYFIALNSLFTFFFVDDSSPSSALSSVCACGCRNGSHATLPAPVNFLLPFKSQSVEPFVCCFMVRPYAHQKCMGRCHRPQHSVLQVHLPIQLVKLTFLSFVRLWASRITVFSGVCVAVWSVMAGGCMYYKALKRPKYVTRDH